MTYLIFFRCPHLVNNYGALLAVYQSLVTIYVVANFGLATFMDPGTYPRGRFWFLRLCLALIGWWFINSSWRWGQRWWFSCSTLQKYWGQWNNHTHEMVRNLSVIQATKMFTLQCLQQLYWGAETIEFCKAI